MYICVKRFYKKIYKIKQKTEHREHTQKNLSRIIDINKLGIYCR